MIGVAFPHRWHLSGMFPRNRAGGLRFLYAEAAWGASRERLLPSTGKQ
jgi:hypothetical protein